MIKVKDFPEWTPPINGWQYRFRITRKEKGYVIDAHFQDNELGLGIDFRGHTPEDLEHAKPYNYQPPDHRWFLEVNREQYMQPEKGDIEEIESRLHFSTYAYTLQAAIDAWHAFLKNVEKSYGAR